MAREDITFEDIFYAIKRQANENEVEGVFRLHILRFWDNERVVKFCLHLLGFDSENGKKWLENQCAQRQWIPVSERLPESSDYYLCCVSGQETRNTTFSRVTLAYIQKYGWCTNGLKVENVTHWQPLPEPPQEQN